MKGSKKICPSQLRKPILDLHERLLCGGGWGLERTFDRWACKQDWRQLMPLSFFELLDCTCEHTHSQLNWSKFLPRSALTPAAHPRFDVPVPRLAKLSCQVVLPSCLMHSIPGTTLNILCGVHPRRTLQRSNKSWGHPSTWSNLWCCRTTSWKACSHLAIVRFSITFFAAYLVTLSDIGNRILIWQIPWVFALMMLELKYQRLFDQPGFGDLILGDEKKSIELMPH